MAENQGALERGYIKANLIRDLALGELSQAKLAEKHGVSGAAISQFKQRHQLDIERAQAAIDDEYAPLWAASKYNRIAEYQDHVDRITAILDENGAGSSVPTAEMLRTAQSALKSIAEEKGELPNRANVHVQGGVSVRYIVDGLDPGDLR